MKKTIFTTIVILSLVGCVTTKNNDEIKPQNQSDSNTNIPTFTQNNTFQDVVQALGEPTKTVRVGHKSRYYYETQDICIYLDGSGSFLGTEKGACNTQDSYDQKFY